jgi:hypothetical protein
MFPQAWGRILFPPYLRHLISGGSPPWGFYPTQNKPSHIYSFIRKSLKRETTKRRWQNTSTSHPVTFVVSHPCGEKKAEELWSSSCGSILIAYLPAASSVLLLLPRFLFPQHNVEDCRNNSQRFQAAVRVWWWFCCGKLSQRIAGSRRRSGRRSTSREP